MTNRVAVRLDDADLAALDELAAIEGVSRSEAARHAIRYRASGSIELRNMKDQRRIDSLLGNTPGTPWSSTQQVLEHSADASLTEDLADAFGDESTDV
jgi:predicted transcriptional regulator